MSNDPSREREELIELARRLLAGNYTNDEEADRDLADFSASVPHPRASDLIFHWTAEFSAEPTPEEVVDRALSYRAIEL